MQLGSTAQNAAFNAPKALLLVKRPLAVDRPVMVFFDGSASAEQGFKAAARFAFAFRSRLVVFLANSALQKTKALKHQATGSLSPIKIQATFRPLRHTDVLYLADAVEAEGGDLLVLNRQYELIPEDEIQRLVRLVSNPVLLVR